MRLLLTADPEIEVPPRLYGGIERIVDMLVRRPAIPRVSYIRWTDWSAFLNTFADLDDEQKWKLASWVQKNHSPPPGRALARARCSARIAVNVMGMCCVIRIGALSTIGSSRPISRCSACGPPVDAPINSTRGVVSENGRKL